MAWIMLLLTTQLIVSTTSRHFLSFLHSWIHFDKRTSPQTSLTSPYISWAHQHNTGILASFLSFKKRVVDHLGYRRHIIFGVFCTWIMYVEQDKHFFSYQGHSYGLWTLGQSTPGHNKSCVSWMAWLHWTRKSRSPWWGCLLQRPR